MTEFMNVKFILQCNGGIVLERVASMTSFLLEFFYFALVYIYIMLLKSI